MNRTTSRGNIEWYLIGFAAALLFVLGVGGFLRHAAWHNLHVTLLDSIYLTLQLIPLNSGGLASPVPVELELARFLFPALAAVTAIKAGLQLFQSELRLLKLHWIKDHIIICGLSRKGMLLAVQFRQLGAEVVIIERNEENEYLPSCREQEMLIIHGDASDKALLARAGVHRARCLAAAVEDDGVNAEIMVEARSLVKARDSKPLVCLAHIADPQLCALLRERENDLENKRFQMVLFNVFEQGARGLVNQYPAWTDAQVASGFVPRVLVIGMGHMGEYVVVELARNWWNQRQESRRIDITVIDRYAGARTASLQARYPQLEKACELTPLQMDINDAEFETAAFLKDRRGRLRFDRVYVCLDDDSLGLHAALVLLRHVPNGSLPIVIRMREDNGLTHLLTSTEAGSKKYRSLSAFAYLEYACSPKLITDTPRDILARAAHEDYLLIHATTTRLPKDDPSLQPWEMLDEQYRHSNYAWVDHISGLLANIGYNIVPLEDWEAPSHAFTDEQVEQMAQSEHENWRRERLALGWTYAPGLKNLKLRTNPLLVPWAELADQDRDGNRSLVRRIPAFLGKAGYQVKNTQESEIL